MDGYTWSSTWWPHVSKPRFSEKDKKRFVAAWNGDAELLRRALTIENVNDTDRSSFKCFGHIVLHYVARNGHVECVKLCLELHANVNANRTLYMHTPLHYAVARYHNNGPCSMTVIRLLLDAGANVDAPLNRTKTTPLGIAIRDNLKDVVKLLIDRGAQISNVKVGRNEAVDKMPIWVYAISKLRSNCRNAAIMVTAIHKYHPKAISSYIDINVMRLISKHIWSTRMDDVWRGPLYR
jgi:hypothetical protein